MLTVSDREKLGKLLAKIGSPDDAEVLTAARQADKLLAKRRETWAALLAPAPAPSPEFPPAPDHVHEALDLLRRGKRYLSVWERDFLLGVMTFRVPRPAQLETLRSIGVKVAAALEIDRYTD
jgi:hypothetical protein